MADIKLKGRDGTETTYTGVATITVPTATGGTVSFGAPVLQALIVTPTAQQQTITPETGYDAFNQVTVNTDANLIPGNIKSGVTIFGVVGTHEGGGNTPTLNAPTITLTDDTLTITNPASNGNFVAGYKIYDGNTLLDTISASEADLSTYELADGNHTITVKAAGTYFTDSAASNSVTYTVSSGYNLTIDVSSSAYTSTGPLYLYIKLNSAPANANDYDIRIFAPDSYSDYENHGVDGPLSGGQYIGDSWNKVLSATDFYIWGEGHDYLEYGGELYYQPNGGSKQSISGFTGANPVAYSDAVHVALATDTLLHVSYRYFQGSWD